MLTSRPTTRRIFLIRSSSADAGSAEEMENAEVMESAERIDLEDLVRIEKMETASPERREKEGPEKIEKRGDPERTERKESHVRIDPPERTDLPEKKGLVRTEDPGKTDLPEKIDLERIDLPERTDPGKTEDPERTGLLVRTDLPERIGPDARTEILEDPARTGPEERVRREDLPLPGPRSVPLSPEMTTLISLPRYFLFHLGRLSRARWQALPCCLGRRDRYREGFLVEQPCFGGGQDRRPFQG